MTDMEIRFWDKVRIGDYCWEWQAQVVRNGYGRFRFFTRKTLAHRASWQMVNGPIPHGLFVCHKCDNRRCVRPSHLFLGTNEDNMADMVAKGRSAACKRVGEDSPVSKLTDDSVREIRRMAAARLLPQMEIAKRFGVCRTTVKNIIGRRAWRHVS